MLVDASGVLAEKTIVCAATGAYHTLVLCSDGTVAAWGNNSNGQSHPPIGSIDVQNPLNRRDSPLGTTHPDLEIFEYPELRGTMGAAVVDQWSVRCISPFRQVSDLACNRSWAEPVKPERTIHQATRLHLTKEEPRMKWN